jgi:signal transduction histidine kinase
MHSKDDPSSDDSGAGALDAGRLIELERLVALGRLAAAIHHDLVQPIGAAELNASHLAELAQVGPALLKLVERHARQMAPDDARRAQTLAEDVTAIGADLLASLASARDLLAQVRRVARAPGEEVSRVEPTPALHFAAGACRSLAVRSRVTLSFHVPDGLPAVELTFADLVSVAMNVVSNGIHAVAGGHIAGGHVEATAYADPTELVLVVKDDGPGIPADVLPKIGRPFFSTRPDGVGLGVAHCRRVIAAAGGAFRIHSAPGEGTVVLVRLPRAAGVTPQG